MSDVGKEIGRIAVSAATGGVGKAVAGAVQRQASGAVRSGANKAAEKYLAKRGNNKKPQDKKLNGWGFWAIFALAFVKELLDILANFTVVLAILSVIGSLLITFIVWFYLAVNGVSLDKSKFAVYIISIIVEIIPGLNMFPTFPLTLLIVRIMENGGIDLGKLQKFHK
jgi:hypothetical protein